MKHAPQKGFSLLEVLIAIVILAIGILGMSGMQGKALYNNYSAQMRSKAMILAHDMAERMRANRTTALAAAANYQANMTKTSQPTSPSVDCDTSSCTGDEIASFDKYQWWQDLVEALPNPESSITVDTNKRLATISIKWEDNHDRFHNTMIDPFILEAQL